MSKPRKIRFEFVFSNDKPPKHGDQICYLKTETAFESIAVHEAEYCWFSIDPVTCSLTGNQVMYDPDTESQHKLGDVITVECNDG